jgi:hypothetical protein
MAGIRIWLVGTAVKKIIRPRAAIVLLTLKLSITNKADIPNTKP